MENNNIDEIFQNGTQKHYAYDEQLWTAVAADLPPIKKGGLWWFNLNTLLLIMVLFVCSTLPSDTINQNYSENSATVIPTVETKLTAQILKPNSINLSKNKIATIKNEVNSSQSTEPNLNGNKIASVTSSKTNPASNQKITAAVKPALNKSVATTSRLKSTQVKSGNNNLIASKAKGLPLNKKSNLAAVIPTITSLGEGFNLNRKNLNSRLELNSLPKSSYLFYNSPTPSPISASTQKRRKLKSTFIYYEIEASTSIAVTKKLSGNNASLLDYKTEHETANQFSTIGINQIMERKHVIYGAGISYAEYTETVNYPVKVEEESTISTFDTNYRIVNGNFNSNGNPVLLIQQVINETKTPTTIIVDDQFIATNTFKRLSIPVFVGLHKSIGNWTAQLRTSLLVNYAFEEEGFYIQENRENTSALNESKQLNNLFLGNNNQLSLGYALQEQIAIGGRFSYYQDLGSFTNGYNSKINYQAVGLWLLWKPE